MADPLLRALVDLRDRQIQKTRIAFGLRVGAIERQADDAARSGQKELAERYEQRFRDLEAELDGDIKRVVEGEPIYPYVSAVKGVGPMFAAKLIAMIDIERAPTVSALWRYCGQGNGKYWHEGNAVVAPHIGYQYDKRDERWVQVRPEPKEGWELRTVRDRPVAGYKLCYNARLKKDLYLIGTSFLRANSPYRTVYDEAKAFYQMERDWTKGHCDMAARRRMTKLFLSHYWLVARTLAGLPVRAPYSHEYLNHTTYQTPESFGWPSLQEKAA